MSRILAAADKAANPREVQVLLPSVARNGRLAYPLLGEVTNGSFLDSLLRIVEVYEPDGVEVEFVTGSGHTQAPVTLTTSRN